MWLWIAIALALVVLNYYGRSRIATIVAAATVYYAFVQLRMRMSCIYVGPGWLRRRNDIVQIDHLAQITYRRSVMHSSAGDLGYNVRLTDRDGRTLTISSADLKEESILDHFRRGLYKSVASGLVLDAPTRAFVIRHLLAWPLSLDSAAAVHARQRKKREASSRPPLS